MDYHPSSSQADLLLPLPSGIVHDLDLRKNIETLRPIQNIPGTCPLKMSTNYRKQRTRFPYKSQRKNG